MTYQDIIKNTVIKTKQLTNRLKHDIKTTSKDLNHIRKEITNSAKEGWNTKI